MRIVTVYAVSIINISISFHVYFIVSVLCDQMFYSMIIQCKYSISNWYWIIIILGYIYW